MRPFLLVMSFLCLFFSIGSAQKFLQLPPNTTLDPNGNSTANVHTLSKEMEGTYQLVITNNDYAVAISKAMLLSIKSSRKQDETVSKTWDEFTTIVIPSVQEISSPDFKKLETVVYPNKN